MQLRLAMAVAKEPYVLRGASKRADEPRKRKHSTAQHSTAQHSTAQHSTAQHSTHRRQVHLLIEGVSLKLKCLLLRRYRWA